MFPVKLRYREESNRQRTSAIKSMVEGLRFVWQEKRILQLIIMSLIPNFLFQPLAFLLPVFTTEVLHRGAGSGAFWRRRLEEAGLSPL